MSNTPYTLKRICRAWMALPSEPLLVVVTAPFFMCTLWWGSGVFSGECTATWIKVMAVPGLILWFPLCFWFGVGVCMAFEGILRAVFRLWRRAR